MTWIRRLYDTYEYVSAHGITEGGPPPLPICHTTQNAHVEIIVDGEGRFLAASALPPRSVTLIPSTEASAGRTSAPEPHPLCDKLVYVAGDFAQVVGPVASGIAKEPDKAHGQYVRELDRWADSPHSHPKVRAIRAYVKQARTMRDLVQSSVLRTDAEGNLLKSWDGERSDRPPIFATLGNVAQHEALVRWRVEMGDDPLSATWEDTSLIDSWIAYYRSTQTKLGFDMVTGSDDVILAEQHPARLRSGADKAKLISSNDKSGFTFRGRFFDADEAASVSFEVTQKVHNALRWLIEREQAYRDGDQVFVIWSPGGPSVPPPWTSSDELPDAPGEPETVDEVDEYADDYSDLPADTAEQYARRLRRKMRGYSSDPGDRDDVVVLGLDSATPGRMSITFYREVARSTLLARVERWHTAFAWYQDYGGGRTFLGAPSPRDIVEAAHGRRASDALRRATFERLLPCIVDGVPVPRDLVRSVVQQACQPESFERDRRGRRPGWEKTLGIACSLIRGTHVGTEYSMGLDTDRDDRDYLYGRLLAIADNIERFTLDKTGETRETNADRLFQRFAQHPAKTWRTLELALRPYMSRLQSNDQWRGFLVRRKQQMDDAIAQFQPPKAFEDDSPLGSAFLMAFHTQRRELRGQRDSDE